MAVYRNKEADKLIKGKLMRMLMRCSGKRDTTAVLDVSLSTILQEDA